MKIILVVLLTCLSINADYKVSVFLGKEADAKYQADMDYPFGVEFDSKGNMYVVEYDGSCVCVLDSKGNFTKLGGDGSRGFEVKNGAIKNARFNGLHNVIIDNQDKVYVTDTFNHVLRKYDPKTGNISNFAGGNEGFSGDGGQAINSAWNELYCAAWNKNKSKIYIADLKNNRVRMVDYKSGIVITVAGNGKSGIPVDGEAALNSPLKSPRAIALDSKGNLYIADRGGHALRVVRPNGKIYTLVNKKGKKGRELGDGVKAQLFGPKYLAIDKDDKVWIADDQNDRICLYDPETKQLESVIGKDSNIKDWDIKRPHGITIHKDGSIYIVDSGNDRILKLTK